MKHEWSHGGSHRKDIPVSRNRHRNCDSCRPPGNPPWLTPLLLGAGVIAVVGFALWLVAQIWPYILAGVVAVVVLKVVGSSKGGRRHG